MSILHAYGQRTAVSLVIKVSQINFWFRKAITSMK